MKKAQRHRVQLGFTRPRVRRHLKPFETVTVIKARVGIWRNQPE